MTDDDTTPPAERPEFNALVFELRALVRRQDGIQKAQTAHRNASLVMARAATAFAEGRITGADYTRLHAVRLRLDAMLPLPGDQPPALGASALRPIDGDE